MIIAAVGKNATGKDFFLEYWLFCEPCREFNNLRNRNSNGEQYQQDKFDNEFA